MDIKVIIDKLVANLDKSYAPYSKFNVSSAVVTTEGQVFFGVNVENASYGLSICAERSTIVSMVPQIGKFKIAKVVVISRSKLKTPPCGACRQFISEFADKECEVILPYGDNYEQLSEHKFADLLPHSFSLDED